MVKRERSCLVESVDARMYHWVGLKLVGIISYFDNVEKVEEAHVEVGCSSDWSVSHIDTSKRIASFLWMLHPLLKMCFYSIEF